MREYVGACSREPLRRRGGRRRRGGAGGGARATAGPGPDRRHDAAAGRLRAARGAAGRPARRATIPVILLSARAGEEARVEGLEAGADDYLVKPFSARELLARVDAHLQMARIRNDAEAALRHADRMEAVGRLAGGVAHEANNQMTVVMGCANFALAMPGLPLAVVEDLERIRRAAAHTADRHLPAPGVRAAADAAPGGARSQRDGGILRAGAATDRGRGQHHARAGAHTGTAAGAGRPGRAGAGDGQSDPQRARAMPAQGRLQVATGQVAVPEASTTDREEPVRPGATGC